MIDDPETMELLTLLTPAERAELDSLLSEPRYEMTLEELVCGTYDERIPRPAGKEPTLAELVMRAGMRSGEAAPLKTYTPGLLNRP